MKLFCDLLYQEISILYYRENSGSPVLLVLSGAEEFNHHTLTITHLLDLLHILLSLGSWISLEKSMQMLIPPRICQNILQEL